MQDLFCKVYSQIILFRYPHTLQLTATTHFVLVMVFALVVDVIVREVGKALFVKILMLYVKVIVVAMECLIMNHKNVHVTLVMTE